MNTYSLSGSTHEDAYTIETAVDSILYVKNRDLCGLQTSMNFEMNRYRYCIRASEKQVTRRKETVGNTVLMRGDTVAAFTQELFQKAGMSEAGCRSTMRTVWSRRIIGGSIPMA